MDGKAHPHRLIGALATALAATLLAIPAANANPNTPQQPAQDGWYYSVLSQGTTHTTNATTDGWYYTILHTGQTDRSAASNTTPCQTNHTYQQAVDAGALPAIVAALHGGASVGSGALPSC